MYKVQLAIISLVMLCCKAEGGGYGGSSGSGGYGGSYGSYGGSSGGGRFEGSYGGISGGFIGSRRGHRGDAGSRGVAGPVQAAVQTRHTVEYIDVDLPQDDVHPQVVEVDAGVLPLVIHFKSASSRIQVHQSHQGAGAGEVQHTQSEDEPHRLVHEVTKPIIQEVREVITPYRRVIQEIRPVEEEVKTIVARGDRRRDFGVDGGIGLDDGGYGGGSFVGSKRKGSGGSYGGSYGGSRGGKSGVKASYGGSINSISSSGKSYGGSTSSDSYKS